MKTLSSLSIAVSLMMRRLMTTTTSGLSNPMVKYNFGAATSKLPGLFGIEAPGTPMKPDGPYNEKGSVPNDVVRSWVDFIGEKGVKRTLCLLTPEELDCYANPGYEAILAELGVKSHLVNVFEDGAHQKCVEAYREAREAGESMVLHCSGGEGRTGAVIGALLVSESGLAASEAEAEVLATAESEGTKRKLSAKKVEKLTGSGTLK